MLLSLVLFAACSGKGTDVGLKVSRSFAISASNGGGAVLYISNSDTKDTKTIVVEKEEVTITLLNGTWDFSVVTWNGTSPLAGDISCDRKSAVLSGQKVEINLEPSAYGCNTTHFSKKELTFMNCNSLSGIAPGETCNDEARGQAGSYQVFFESPGNKVLRSSCIKASSAPDSIVSTGLSLPFTYIKDFKFDLFSDAACSSGKKTYPHTEALSNDGTLYFAYGEVGSSPIALNNPPEALGIPNAIKVTPYSIAIPLPYSDAENDIATSCTITSHSGNLSIEACLCEGSLCTANFIGTTYGPANFSYTVMAHGQVSNVANASLHIVDLPELTYSPSPFLGIVGNFISISPLVLGANGEVPTCSISPAPASGLYFDHVSCILSGVPSNMDSTVYTVVASNFAGSTNASFTLTVNGLPPSVDYTGALIQDFYTDGYLNITPVINDHGLSVTSCNIVPALPAGLYIDYNCVISGTSVSPVDQAYTVIAANAAGSANIPIHLKVGSPFISEWITYSPSETITLPLVEGEAYDLKVDWGDGSPVSVISSWDSPEKTHSYDNAGNYVVKIYGNIPRLKVDSINKMKIVKITQWGTSNWTSMELAFAGCSNLQVLATDAPNLTLTTSLKGMFEYAAVLNGDFGHWDTSTITSMSYMFKGASSFNGNISSWNTSNVTDMSYMFSNATNFNQPLDGWNTSKVTNMSAMFQYTQVFNQPLNNWDTSSVTDMSYMFLYAASFDQPLSNWQISNVVTMTSMFANANNFNQDLSGWTTLSVTDSTNFSFNAVNWVLPKPTF